ncbi:carbon-monoxide dehydrogenase large subunit [Parafrankia irregularis]|uniref:Carbon-monoxide dehydrogenase large subunit n=1 Tax=Parafrankia irregularis TaxID=795642 RepID=A0A0S4QIH2_9ACTN|nr:MULTISPECIES: xanthine dehydrogenase family protein molybdopterin-binding subunit [Parafrankia]MBE3203955.1 xanthine dehydrogenase family protein molybdopterin-binding subunit [Parafrankia sp. CH37]CUU55172.1 carbon-monoxide dehydrogenase large subunit [Parafrankia irregularis]
MSGSQQATESDRYAGRRVKRVEDARLLTGRGTFVDDVVRPGMLHVNFVRSPVARARITGIDISEALALDGVHAVLTAADINPHVHEQWFSLEGRHAPDTPRPPLAEGEVRHVGDPVAMIIAQDRYIAEDAAELVIVDYDQLPPVVDYATAFDSSELVHEAYPGNLVGQIGGRPMADLAPTFDSAPHVVSETYHQQAYCAMPMETRGIVTEWSPSDGTMTIWTATQSPHEVRGFCARLLAIPEHSVRVVMRDTGGGFGQKVLPLREDMCMMIAATKVPAPLKWIEDRQEHLLAAGQARHEHGEARMAFDDDGRILAATIDHVQDAGAYPSPNPVGSGIAVGLIFPGPYRIPEGTFNSRFAFSNTSGRVAYRGPWQFESVARECLLDVAARQIGIDPVELRRKNMLRRDELPTANCNGMPYSDITPLETFEQALEILDYDAFRREQEQARAAGRYIGVGTCTYVEPTAGASALYGTEGATIRVEPSGKVNVYVAGGSCGNSLETTVIQLTADALGVDIADVSSIQGDTAVTPFGGGTGGSRSGPMTAGAVNQTATELRGRILALAAHLLGGVPVDEVEFTRGVASVKGSPEKQVTLAEIAETAYFKSGSLPAELSVGLEVSGRFRAQHLMLWANATHVCTCEVDIVTGEVKLLRYIVSEDCGPMINPNVVEGQIFGGTVQGIGGALYEELAYDDAGNPVTTTFMDYLLPTAAEVPTIELGHVETPSIGPGGYKGVGEGGAIGAPPAVINAVADALAPFGVRISRLPLTPSTIIDLLEEAAQRGAAGAAGAARTAVAG